MSQAAKTSFKKDSARACQVNIGGGKIGSSDSYRPEEISLWDGPISRLKSTELLQHQNAGRRKIAYALGHAQRTPVTIGGIKGFLTKDAKKRSKNTREMKVLEVLTGQAEK